jgi:hypothetical protein
METLAVFAVGLVAVAALRVVLARHGPDRPSNWERRRYVHRSETRENLVQDALPRVERGPGTVPCSACGTDNDADFEFCRECGGALETR